MSRYEVPDLVGALRDALRDDRDNDSWRPDVLHPSDLAVAIDGSDGRCARQLWLRVNGAESTEKHDGELFMFLQGHRLEREAFDLIRDYLVAEGWSVIGRNKDVSWTLPVGIDTGELDRLLEGPNGERIVVDVKSVRGRAIDWLRAEGPKAANVLQVQTYIMAEDADAGVLFYLDREGQNFAVQFEVERNDEAVLEAREVARDVVDSPIPPLKMSPLLTRNANKGPDSVKVEMPWQCQYCPFLDVSCEGALPKDKRARGVVGHIDDSGSFTPKAGREHLTDLVLDLVEMVEGAA